MLHHLELYVSELEKSIAFWSPLMRMLDYAPERWSGGMNYLRGDSEAYLCLLPAPKEHLSAGYHRKRVGLNHLAFLAKSRTHVDEIHAYLLQAKAPLLYEDRYPFAGGENYYAVYVEDPDRMKLEIVAPGAD